MRFNHAKHQSIYESVPVFTNGRHEIFIRCPGWFGNNAFRCQCIERHIFVFFNRRRDRVKLLCWESDGFGLYYKRLEHGTFSWVQDLDLDDGGEIQASDFAMILAGIIPRTEVQTKANVRKVLPRVAPLTLV